MTKSSSPRPDGLIDHGAVNGALRLARPAAAEPKAQPIDPDEPAAVAIHRSLSFGVERLRGSEAAARAREPEGIHRMRTSSRRLRSVLRTFDALLDTPWAEALEAELKWLGRRLGEVRDLDVLQEHLLAEAGDARPALGPLFESLRVRSEASRRALDEALDGARFGELMRRLAEATDRPRLRDEAWEPCRSALPALVREAWKRVKKRGRGLRDDDPDEDFHETRKRAKAARYAAEAVMNALGGRAGRHAERFADRARKVQDVLGAHQDAVVAAAEVARVAATYPEDRAFQDAAAALGRRLQESADDSRKRFFKAWRKLDRKKVRRWLEK
jgi:CHAD domain-containing protein